MKSGWSQQSAGRVGVSAIIGSMLAFGALAPLPLCGATNITYRLGVNGLVKERHWFAVSVEPAESVAQLEVISAGGQYSRNNSPRQRITAPPGQASLVCRAQGEGRLLCRVTTRSGKRYTRLLTPRRVGDEQHLIGIVSDDPAAFDYLTGLQGSPCSLAALTPLTPRSMPDSWLTFKAIDTVLIDRPSPRGYSERQLAALHQWVVTGGRIILTPKAFADGPPTWADTQWIDVLPTTNQVDAATLIPHLDERAGKLTTLSHAGLRATLGTRVLWSGETALLAAKQIGQGTVVAVGARIDVNGATDLRTAEILRKEFWKLVFDTLPTSPSAHHASLRVAPLIPQVAFARHLKWYFIGFLLLYIVIFGLVNFIILLKLRRFELNVITLPVGALLLATLAYGLGVWLRGTEAHISDSTIMVVHDSDVALRGSTDSYIKADRRPVDLTVGDRQVDAATGDYDRYSSYSYNPWNDNTGDLGDEDAMTISNEGIVFHARETPMWTLRTVTQSTVVDAGAGIASQVEFDAGTLGGSISNGLPHALTDAYVFYRWHRRHLGTIPAGATVSFSLPLISSLETKGARCPNCHDIHDGDDLEVEGDGIDPLPEEQRDHYREGIQAATVAHDRPTPQLVARYPDGPALLTINRTPVVRTNRTLVATELTWVQDALPIQLPFGVLSLDVAAPPQTPLHSKRRDAAQIVPAIAAALGVAWKPAAEGNDRPSRGYDPFDDFSQQNYGLINANSGGDHPRDTRRIYWTTLPETTQPWQLDQLQLSWALTSLPESMLPHQPVSADQPAYVLSAFNWSSRSWTNQLVTSARGSTNRLTLLPARDYMDADTYAIALAVDFQQPPRDPMNRDEVPTAHLEIAVSARPVPRPSRGSSSAP